MKNDVDTTLFDRLREVQKELIQHINNNPDHLESEVSMDQGTMLLEFLSSFSPSNPKVVDLEYMKSLAQSKSLIESTLDIIKTQKSE